MTLALYGHPFSSYTQKTLIALYENGIPFEFRCVGPEWPKHTEEWLGRWPLAKFPVLLDGEEQLTEASIIIEYLHLQHPGPVRLLPDDPMDALDVRFLDRFFDLHIMDMMQLAVDGAIGRLPISGEQGLEIVIPKLNRAYDWLEQHLEGKTWAAGDTFTMADCGAAPFLFYAHWNHPFADTHPRLRAFLDRLLKRPSFARAVDEARPWRENYPFKTHKPPS